MNYVYRELQVDDIEETKQLVMRVYNEYVAPGYSKEGNLEFEKYITREQMEKRFQSETYYQLGCFDKDKLVGMIEARNMNHICNFFVDSKYHGKGIGRSLWEYVYKHSEANEFTVNASPFSVRVYEKLGFKKISEEQVVNGIRLTKMVFKDDLQ